MKRISPSARPDGSSATNPWRRRLRGLPQHDLEPLRLFAVRFGQLPAAAAAPRPAGPGSGRGRAVPPRRRVADLFAVRRGLFRQLRHARAVPGHRRSGEILGQPGPVLHGQRFVVRRRRGGGRQGGAERRRPGETRGDRQQDRQRERVAHASPGPVRIAAEILPDSKGPRISGQAPGATVRGSHAGSGVSCWSPVVVTATPERSRRATLHRRRSR